MTEALVIHTLQEALDACAWDLCSPVETVERMEETLRALKEDLAHG